MFQARIAGPGHARRERVGGGDHDASPLGQLGLEGEHLHEIVDRLAVLGERDVREERRAEQSQQLGVAADARGLDLAAGLGQLR